MANTAKTTKPKAAKPKATKPETTKPEATKPIAKPVKPKPKSKQKTKPIKIENLDCKNRLVILSGGNKSYKVEKPQTGFCKKSIRTLTEAKEIFQEQINTSNNQ